MVNIEKIIYRRNDNNYIISIGEECLVKYNDKAIKYGYEDIEKNIKSIILMTYDWEREYIDNFIIDGDNWSLSIKYKNGREVNYNGSGKFPYNIDAFEKILFGLVIGD